MKFFILSLIWLILLIPGFSLAQGGFDDGGAQGSFDDAGPQGSFDSNSVTLPNPLGEIDSFPELIKAILDAAFIIGLPIAVLFIVLAGFRFVWARGNPSELQKARLNLLYTIVGIAVFFGAWLIATIIKTTIETLGISL